jgi:hypothetical protein
VPSVVVIPEGATVKNFTILTRKVTAQKKPVIALQAVPGVAASKILTVNPPDLTGISFNPSTIGLKEQTKGTVTFETGVAGGTVVQLSASPGGVLSMPSSVTVSGGLTAVSFYATSNLITTDTDVTVTAKLGTSQVSTIVSVRVPSVASLKFSPTRVTGGSTATGIVTLSGVAPPGGVAVTIVSANPNYADVVGSHTITVPAGSKSKTFPVSTRTVSRTVAVQFTATSSFGASSVYLYIPPYGPVSPEERRALLN